MVQFTERQAEVAHSRGWVPSSEWGHLLSTPNPTAFTAFATWPRWQQRSVTTTLGRVSSWYLEEKGSGSGYQSLDCSSHQECAR